MVVDDRWFVPIANWVDQPLKMAHDSYAVKVNGELVGDKVLVTQSDSVDDVSHFLQSRGFHDFGVHVIGGECDIRVTDEDVAEDVKRHLEVYLNTR